MKKFLIFLLLLILIFIGLTYWSVSSTDKTFETSQTVNFGEKDEVNFKLQDSILVVTSTLYNGDFPKQFMQGENYRKAWATPIKVPVAYLDTLKGGLEFVEEGGGTQTQSLKFKSKDGILYSLRSVNKDPNELVPEVAYDLGLENIVVDGISAQHPQGAILAAKLAAEANILHTHPQLLFIPKQNKLSNLNNKYGNRLYLLEYETESKSNWTNFENVNAIIETEELLELKQKKGDKLKIDRKELIKVRLFDLLIGDWDRHAEQWGWVLVSNDDSLNAIPLPGDRDNAFFKISGVIPSIMTNRNIQPLVRPFENDIDYLPGLVYPFDRYFLLKASETEFIDQAKILQQQLTDEVIENAFSVWPAEINELNKAEIKAKIINRREDLQKYALEFHRIIQERGKLTEPLKGSEELKLSSSLLACFDCEN